MKILSLGLYPLKKFPRDRVFIDFAREKGVEVTEVICEGSWVSKAKAARSALKEREYDLVYVAYSSGILVSFARIWSKKTVVFNALCSMYEGIVLDRGQFSKYSPRAIFIWFIDFLSFNLAHLSFVESHEQKKYIQRFFKVKAEKLGVLYTIADERTFHPETVAKRPKFTALFRGAFLPFIGVEYAVAAAKEAKRRGEAIDFLILGRGPLGPSLKKEIEENGLSNVTIDESFFSDDDLRRLMLSCHVSLGQLSDHERTWRTIPHKIFETIALGMPLLTARTKSQEEFLCDGKDCLFFKGADVSQLVDKLVALREDIALRDRIARGGYALYKERFTRETIGEGFMKEIKKLANE